MTINKAINLLNETLFQSNEFVDRLYASAQLHKIDNVFKFFKIYRMTTQREEIIQLLQSERYQDKMGFSSRFECDNDSDITSPLKDIVFENTDFIDFCLKTEYHDPFGYFKSVVSDCYSPKVRYIIEQSKNINDFYNFCIEETKIGIEEELKKISKDLWEDVFAPINAVRNVEFEPTDQNGEEYKKHVDELIQTLSDIKYFRFKQLKDLSNEIRFQTNKNTLNSLFYEYFKIIQFIPDKTNFLNMIYDKDYNEKDANSYLETHETVNTYINKAVEFDKSYNSFWEEYYFSCRSALDSFATLSKKPDEYSNYLLGRVLDNLKDICH